MQAVNITEFRQNLPQYIKKVREGEEIQVTSRGKTVARMMPAESEQEAAMQRIKSWRGTLKITGDIVSPVISPDAWTGDVDNL